MGAVWVFATLMLCKSLGALMIAIAFVPVALFCRPRVQLMIAACIVGIVMTYPILRGVNVIPVPEIINFVEDIDQSRAQSLAFRFRHEDLLLEHARERPVFGWGGWARNRVFDEQGEDISVTDGTWVIQFGMEGGFAIFLFLDCYVGPSLACFLVDVKTLIRFA